MINDLIFFTDFDSKYIIAFFGQFYKQPNQEFTKKKKGGPPPFSLLWAICEHKLANLNVFLTNIKLYKSLCKKLHLNV